MLRDWANDQSFMDGNLRRSQVLSQTSNKIMDFDDRILGSGEFATELRSKGLLTDEHPTSVGLTQHQQSLKGVINSIKIESCSTEE